jgi:hypothetical protein
MFVATDRRVPMGMGAKAIAELAVANAVTNDKIFMVIVR